MESHRLSLKITGHSMAPLISDGDTIDFRSIENTPCLGDLALFKDKETLELTIHRVISINPLITKGDNSFYKDSANQEIISIAQKIDKGSIQIELRDCRVSRQIAFLSKFSEKKNPIRHIFYFLIKILAHLFIIQNKSYLNDSKN